MRDLNNRMISLTSPTFEWTIDVDYQLQTMSDKLHLLQQSQQPKQLIVNVGDTSTKTMTQRAVDTLCVMSKLVQLIQRFNNMESKTISTEEIIQSIRSVCVGIGKNAFHKSTPRPSPTEELDSLICSIQGIYPIWKEQQTNPIFQWILPNKEAQSLISTYMEINTPTGYYLTTPDFSKEAFISLCRKGYLNVAMWMCSLNCVNIPCKDQYNYIFQSACDQTDFSLAKRIVQNYGTYLTTQTIEYGFSTISLSHSACLDMRTWITNILNTIHPSNIRHDNEYPVWFIACRNNNRRVIEDLIDVYGSNHFEKYYHNSLLIASCNGYVNLVQLLYAYFTSKTTLEFEYDALDIACKYSQTDVINRLYEMISIEYRYTSSIDDGLYGFSDDEDDDTMNYIASRVFYHACKERYEYIVKWLYSTKQIKSMDDAFVIACINGHHTIVEWIYSLGVINLHSQAIQPAFKTEFTFILDFLNDPFNKSLTYSNKVVHSK